MSGRAFSPETKKKTKDIYEEIIQLLLNENQKNPEALLNITLSRTIHGSSLFFHLLSIIQQVEDIKNGKEKAIHCDNYYRFKILQQIVKDRSDSRSLITRMYLQHIFVSFVRNSKKRIKSYVHLILQRWMTSGISHKKFEEKLIIETFLTPSCLTKDSYVNRYYRNIDLYCSSNKIVWFSTLAGFSSFAYYLRGKKLLKKHSINNHFLFLETIVPTLSFLRVLLSSPRIKIPDFHFFGVNLKELIADDISSSRHDISTLKARLTFKGIETFSNYAPELKEVINWDENQVLDHAWNLGFKINFPNIKRKSYRGFVIEEDLDFHVSPSPDQASKGLAGDKYLLIGSLILNSFKLKYPYLNSSAAPAFRFWHLKNITLNPEQKKRVLVCLPISKEESFELLKASSAMESRASNLNFVFRPHPTHSSVPDIVRSLEGKEISTVEISKELENVMAVISNSSSICYESLALGLKVVVFQTFPPFDLNPIPTCGNFKNFISTANIEDVLVFLSSNLESQQIDASDFFYFDEPEALSNFFGDFLSR